MSEKIDSKKQYEMVNHPSHYNRYSIEAVEMARRIWGDEAMRTAAEITAFFYRMRLGLKPDNSVEQELAKESFWLDYAKKLGEKGALKYDDGIAQSDRFAELRSKLLND